MLSESVGASTTQIGLSAISINTIIAKSLYFEYPIYDCHIDSQSNQVFVSGKQKNQQINQLMRKSYFAAISGVNDSIRWLNESNLYDIDLSGGQLLVSNESRTMRYNKRLGFDELKYPNKVFYCIPKSPLAFMYANNDNTTLQCVNLKTGLIKWSCTLPGEEDWVDIEFLSDSVMLVAAKGLHSLHLQRGLLWSQSMTTSVPTNKALTYSLANYISIQSVSKVIQTATDENRVTQLASNILTDNNHVYFASKEKCVALDQNGKVIWQIDLRNYPVSKMLLSKTDSSLILVNLGMAAHSSNFVSWGKPFILKISSSTGNIINQYDLSKIENLADFIHTKTAFVFAGKDEILSAVPGESELKSILSLSENKYGKFIQFMDGDQYYIYKEGYYVPLNFINDNLIYFKTDNNKIYGIDGDVIQYEYHYTELFKLEQKFDGKTVLRNDEQTIITSSNFELLFSFNLSEQMLFGKDKIYFVGENRIHILNKKELK